MSETDSRDILIPKTILLVEDDLDLAILFETYIKSANYNVITVYTGEEVADIVSKNYFDLIFLDIGLPGISGFEVLKQLKINPKTKDIPVIMLTNHAELDYMQRSLDLGAADYAIKANVDMEGIKRLANKHLIHLNARFNTEKKEEE